jgi:hypothetical protein
MFQTAEISLHPSGSWTSFFHGFVRRAPTEALLVPNFRALVIPSTSDSTLIQPTSNSADVRSSLEWSMSHGTHDHPCFRRDTTSDRCGFRWVGTSTDACGLDPEPMQRLPLFRLAHLACGPPRWCMTAQPHVPLPRRMHAFTLQLRPPPFLRGPDPAGAMSLDECPR